MQLTCMMKGMGSLVLLGGHLKLRRTRMSSSYADPVFVLVSTSNCSTNVRNIYTVMRMLANIQYLSTRIVDRRAPIGCKQCKHDGFGVVGVDERVKGLVARRKQIPIRVRSIYADDSGAPGWIAVQATKHFIFPAHAQQRDQSVLQRERTRV